MKNLIAIITVLIFALTANADVRKIKFINKEGKDVDDLHIEFKKNNIDWDRDEPHTFDNVRHSPPGDPKYNFWGTTIADGDTVELTFESDHDIEIKEWWWTKGGNALKDGDMVGKKKKDNAGQILVFNGGPATGNGLCMVSVGGHTAMFQTTPGMMPEQTTMQFMNFLQFEFNTTPLPPIYAHPVTPFSLFAASNFQGDLADQIQIEIVQLDLSQPMAIVPQEPSILMLVGFTEGRYSPSLGKMKGDYVNVTFRNSFPPFDVLGTSTTFLDSLGRGEAWTYNIPDGMPFWIQVNHYNSIETWSSNGNKIFNNKRSAHNFSLSPASAFGGNLKQVGTRFCFFSGDTNQDGVIDGTDMSAVDNDAANYATGYLPTDLNGDEAVDATDYAITDNNATAFVGVIRP